MWGEEPFLNPDSLDEGIRLIKAIKKKSRESSESWFKTIYMLYGEITRKIIGCAMAVHSALGNGFQEVIYQRALAIELEDSGLSFTREQDMEIFYKNRTIGTRRVDFFVEQKIMVELKALVALEDVHLAQAMNYLEAYNIEVGLLINFGSKSLEFKRVHNNKGISFSG